MSKELITPTGGMQIENIHNDESIVYKIRQSWTNHENPHFAIFSSINAQDTAAVHYRTNEW